MNPRQTSRYCHSAKHQTKKRKINDTIKHHKTSIKCDYLFLWKNNEKQFKKKQKNKQNWTQW